MSQEYSNFSDPAFNHPTESVSTTTSQLNGGLPHTFAEPTAPVLPPSMESYPLPSSTADMSNTAATFSGTQSQSSVLTSSLPAQSSSPAVLALSSSSSAAAVTGRPTQQSASAAAVGNGPVSDTSGGLNKAAVNTTPVHTLTEGISLHRFIYCMYTFTTSLHVHVHVSYIRSVW